MTRDELTPLMQAMAATGDALPAGPDDLAEVILSALAEHWDALPVPTRAVMLGVATELKRQGADEKFADLSAAQVVREMRGE